MTDGKWEARIRRATELSSVYPYASEALRFYARIANLQRDLYADFRQTFGGPATLPGPATFKDELDLPALVPKFGAFLGAVEKVAPSPLAEAAHALAENGPTPWQSNLKDFWRSRVERAPEMGGSHAGLAPFEAWLSWTFLQPYAECLAEKCDTIPADSAPSTCPVCDARPIVGVLRPEGEMARKSLICMLCSHEWPFRRIYCPACGEEREPQMAFYSAPEIAHVRVDVCDTCHTYLKTVDLTKTGMAVPVVDELAAIPLDLWAREHGYQKLQTNMLGT